MSCDGEFGSAQLREAKLLTFQRLDKVVDAANKGLTDFTRGFSDEDRMKLRLRVLDINKDELQFVAENYLMK